MKGFTFNDVPRLFSLIESPRCTREITKSFNFKKDNNNNKIINKMCKCLLFHHEYHSSRFEHVHSSHSINLSFFESQGFDKT